MGKPDEWVKIVDEPVSYLKTIGYGACCAGSARGQAIGNRQ